MSFAVMEQLLLSGRQCANVCLIFTGIDENRMNTERFFKAPPTSFEEALRRKLYIVVPAQQGGVRDLCSEQLREQLHAQLREQLHAQVREQLHAQLHQWSRCMK